MLPGLVFLDPSCEMVQTGFFENGLQGLCSRGMALTLTTLCILSDPWEPGVRGGEGRRSLDGGMCIQSRIYYCFAAIPGSA